MNGIPQSDMFFALIGVITALLLLSKWHDRQITKTDELILINAKSVIKKRDSFFCEYFAYASAMSRIAKPPRLKQNQPRSVLTNPYYG